MASNKKIELERFGKNGWIFKIHRGVYSNDGRGSHAVNRTNGNGEGIWRKTPNGWTQRTGTTQFSLPKDRKKAYAKLYNLWFKNK